MKKRLWLRWTAAIVLALLIGVAVWMKLTIDQQPTVPADPGIPEVPDLPDPEDVE